MLRSVNVTIEPSAQYLKAMYNAIEVHTLRGIPKVYSNCQNIKWNKIVKIGCKL